MKFDLTIILPGIRPQNWEKLYESAIQSAGSYKFGMIAIGPYDPSENLTKKENFKFLKDFGCPSRCVQLASTYVDSRYITWMSDDGLYLPNTLEHCIQTFDNQLSSKDGITLRYKEGEGDDMYPDDYWKARYHADQRIPGVKEEYRIAPIGMYSAEHFRWIGGLDCRYEHINFCTHDLAFRIQNNGGKIVLSPDLVARFYWSWITSDSGPVQKAYFENDAPLFQKIYSEDQSNRIKIDYDNWKKSPEKWLRRFG